MINMVLLAHIMLKTYLSRPPSTANWMMAGIGVAANPTDTSERSDVICVKRSIMVNMIERV
jgi:hypothetical protein